LPLLEKRQGGVGRWSKSAAFNFRKSLRCLGPSNCGVFTGWLPLGFEPIGIEADDAAYRVVGGSALCSAPAPTAAPAADGTLRGFKERPLSAFTGVQTQRIRNRFP